MGLGTADRLGYRHIEGSFWDAMEETERASWTGDVANTFTTNQPQEEYPWLGHAPVMRKWIGPRTAKELRDDKITLVNDEYEGTIRAKRSDARRDKTGQLAIRAGELGDRAAQLPQKLITDLLKANGNAYDGKAFFADNHVIGDSGTIDNLMGTGDGLAGGAAPTSAQMQSNILLTIQRMLGFTDDTGEPRNEFARSFLVMVPTNMWSGAAAALQDEFTSAGVSNTLRGLMERGLMIDAAMNPRLTSTTQFYVFRRDARVKSFIWQEELFRVENLDENSEHAKIHNEILFGVHRVVAAGYGRFEMAVRGATS